VAPIKLDPSAMTLHSDIGAPKSGAAYGEGQAMADQRAHWDRVYTEKRAEEVSWRQEEPTLSLKLIARTGVGFDAPIVDVGGGASTLVDHLIERGFRDVSVLDIAAPGLEQAKARLGSQSAEVHWVVHDVTTWRPVRRHRLWHDRAVLHFLTDPAAQAAYAATMRMALDGDSWAIIGGFAPGGPAKCSGLEIVQHDGASLAKLLGDAFQLMETHGEIHLTPWGAEQTFRYHLFRRNASSVS
jgi:hypothetical protein